MLAASQPSGDSLTVLIRANAKDRKWAGAGVALAASLHVALAWSVRNIASEQRASEIDDVTEVVDIDLPKPEQPPPTPEQPKPEEAPEPKTSKAVARGERSPPPAQAAAVLTKVPDPNEPVDLTDGFVTGTATSYIGGSTSAAGTNTRAAHTGPLAGGSPHGNPSLPPGGPDHGPDRSRPPGVAGNTEWQCPFPSEADTEERDHAVVTIQVNVDVSGTATKIVVVRDPGSGFARQARVCALERRWNPALDHDGMPTSGSTVVNVHFDR
ncbi:MAG TPA: energy transducer TonB [Polyangiaceae bacterium]|jgi:protein TonB